MSEDNNVSNEMNSADVVDNAELEALESEGGQESLQAEPKTQEQKAIEKLEKEFRLKVNSGCICMVQLCI